MGFLLFIVSIVLSSVLVPIGLVFGFCKQFYKNSWEKAIADIDNKFFSMAIAVDKFGNVVCAELFNFTLIKDNTPHPFGNHRQTASHVIGLNIRVNNLTETGEVVNDGLNLLDPGHSLKSIEE